jgi:hypothetical protein
MAKSTPRSAKTARRPYEYDHHYGLSGTKKAAPTRATRRVSKKAAATRSKAR